VEAYSGGGDGSKVLPFRVATTPSPGLLRWQALGQLNSQRCENNGKARTISLSGLRVSRPCVSRAGPLSQNRPVLVAETGGAAATRKNLTPCQPVPGSARKPTYPTAIVKGGGLVEDLRVRQGACRDGLSVLGGAERS